MATSTELMKDRSAIDTVVQQQKLAKNERNYRVFQAMRLMRREYMKMLLVEDEPAEDGLCNIQRETTVSSKRLSSVTINHIYESFKKLGRPSQRDSHYLTRSTRSESDILSKCSNNRYSRGRLGGIDDPNLVVSFDKIQDLINMCGGDLDSFQKFYLLRRSINQDSEDSHEISLNDFTKAVESYMNDANMDAYALVLYLFKLKFGE